VRFALSNVDDLPLTVLAPDSLGEVLSRDIFLRRVRAKARAWKKPAAGIIRKVLSTLLDMLPRRVDMLLDLLA
jgi:hypothetical protein